MPLIFNEEMPVYKKFCKVRPDTLLRKEDTEGKKVIKLLFFNLMKNKVEAEEQFLRCLSGSEHIISVEFLRQKTYISERDDNEYVDRFYKSLDDIKEDYFDAMIITGAPLDQIKFEDVYYWQEVCSILDWSKEHVKSVFHSCWGALAGLYHDFGVNSHVLPEKVLGIYRVSVFKSDDKLFCGLDEQLHVPISRAMDIDSDAVNKEKRLVPLAGREGKPPVFIKSDDNRLFYSTAHPEYGRERLDYEYTRDKTRTYNYSVNVPKHYYPDDNPENEPLSYWIREADILFRNWIDFYVADDKQNT